MEEESRREESKRDVTLKTLAREMLPLKADEGGHAPKHVDSLLEAGRRQEKWSPAGPPGRKAALLHLDFSQERLCWTC